MFVGHLALALAAKRAVPTVRGNAACSCGRCAQRLHHSLAASIWLPQALLALRTARVQAKVAA